MTSVRLQAAARADHRLPAVRWVNRRSSTRESSVELPDVKPLTALDLPPPCRARCAEAQDRAQSRQIRRVLRGQQGLSDVARSADRGRRLQPRYRARRVRLADRPFRLRQIHGALDGGRPHRSHRWRHRAGWSHGGHRGTGSRHGVPGAQPAALADGTRRTWRWAWSVCFRMSAAAERRDIIEYYLARVGLADAMDRRASELSNGMRQRVGLARAFALSPKLLLLDEPFGMLDALTRWELQEVLMDVWKRSRVTAICVTHDVDEAILLADRVIMMTNGPNARIGTGHAGGPAATAHVAARCSSIRATTNTAANCSASSRSTSTRRPRHEAAANMPRENCEDEAECTDWTTSMPDCCADGVCMLAGTAPPLPAAGSRAHHRGHRRDASCWPMPACDSKAWIRSRSPKTPVRPRCARAWDSRPARPGAPRCWWRAKPSCRCVTNYNSTTNGKTHLSGGGGSGSLRAQPAAAHQHGHRRYHHHPGSPAHRAG